MGNRLEFIVEEQLGQHEQESEGIDTVHCGLDSPAVPGFVGGEDETVHSSS